MNTRHRKKSTGFTLTEILVVVGIVVALAGLIYPLVNYGLRTSRKTKCLNNLRQIGMGLETWLQDHNDVMPILATSRLEKTEEVAVLDTLLVDYIASPEIFRCPEDGEKFAKSGSSYLWNSTQNGRPKAKLFFFGSADLAHIPLITDKEAWHGEKDGANFLFADYSAGGKLSFETSPD